MLLALNVTSPRLSVFPATLGFALILGISGCQTTEQPHKPAPESRFIKTGPKVETTPSPITVPKTQQARAEPSRIFPKLSTLQNLTEKDLHALLGSPSFKRSDDPAEIWQYRVTNCTLDLFLYENLDTSKRSVAHYEIRLQQGQGLTEKSCFESVIKSTDTPSKTS